MKLDKTEIQIINGGETGDLIRKYRWDKTSLGSIQSWPQSLITAVNIMLQSPIPMVMLWGRDGVMIYNDGYSLFAGSKHPSLLGSNVLEGWPEVSDFNNNVMKKVMRGKTLSYKNHQLTLFRNKTAEEVWMDLNYSPIIGENGKPAGVLAIVIEKTQHVLAEIKKEQAEKELYAEKNRLISIFMQAPALIAVLRGPDHVFEYANDGYMQIIGKKRNIIGKSVRKALPELKGQGFFELLDTVYATGKTFTGNELLVQLDKENNGVLEDAYVNLSYQPIRDAQNKVESIFVHAIEVTDMVNARKTIKESEEKYRSLFTSMDQGFCIIEVLFNKKGKPVDYCFLETNPVFETQTGLQNAIGKTAKELVPNLEQHWFDLYGEVALKGKPARFTQGSSEMGRWFDVYAFRIGGKDSRKVAVLFTDISVRKQREETLEKSETYYRELMDNTPVMVWITDVDGKCTYLNKQWFDYTGQVPKKALGFGWLKAVHPSDSKRSEEVFVTANESQKAFNLEYRLRAKDGSYRWHLDSGLPKFGQDGAFEGFVGSVIDIHDRKVLERQKDEFLGIASHELKTPVTSIKAYGQVLQRVFKSEGNERGVIHLAKMDAQVNRLSNLIGDLLDVTKIQSGRMQFHEEYFDFTTLVDEVIEEIQRTTEHHTIAKDFQVTQTVYGDRERISQVLVNLMTNAIKYSPKADKIVVSTCGDSKSVTLCVEDFGVGIPKDKQERVFEQFFRVSGPKQDTFPGLGLGLYISSEIVKREGGRIWVESAVGKGSSFCFTLPVRKKESA